MSTRIESQAEPIPGYRLIERIGGGGFGEVWKAEAPGGLLKAIKFVYGDIDSVDSSESARADQEYKSLQRILKIRHPFILSLERWDKVDGQLMIVTELADKNLWDRFREYRTQGKVGIPRDELMGYLREAAEALDLMINEYDLLHLDVKPQNLFLVHNHVKVADFGLVKTIEGLLASVTGGVTPVYAAPETFDGKVTRTSDQYSLGIVYQELLTGVRPFSGNNTRQLIMQHLEGKPNLDPLPPGDRPIIGRALAKQYENRFPSCSAMIEALTEAGKQASRVALSALEDTSVEPDEAATPTQITSRGGLAPLSGPFPSSQVLNEATNLVKPNLLDASGSDLVSATPPPSVLRTPRPDGFGPEAPAPDSERIYPTQLVRSQLTGDGVLQPALIIGLGEYGRCALQRLRHELENRFGKLNELPHLRMLYLDTDPAANQQVGNPGQLPTDELLLMRLNRPSRYLNTRETTLPPIVKWLDTEMLYRMPRNLVTTGFRAFGRLAFIEYYRSVVTRLRRDFEQITSPGSLEAAARHTGETMRANWPRVIIVSNLAGGSGSGMFLDLAYVVRAQLRMMGFAKPDVMGIFFLPPADDPTWIDLFQANAYAALIELEKAMTPGFPFQAQYEEKAKPLQDSEPPLSRCLLLPISTGLPETQTQQEMAEITGRYLQRVLMTPLGKAADSLRSAATLPSAPAGTSRYQSIGLHVLASPRRALLRHAARRFCQNLLEEWTAKGAPDLVAQIKERLEATLKKHRLDPPTMLERLKSYVVKEVTQKPEDTVVEWIESLRRAPMGELADPAQLRQLLKQADELLGAPFDTNALRQGRLASLARQLAEKFVHKITQGLGGVVLQ